MAVSETGVSYYGISYPEHARADFEEIRAHNCTAVLLALSEFDIAFWFPNISRIVDEARQQGLKVYLDTWGFGKFFGGEPPSLFLQENICNRQVTALTNEPVAAACFSTPAFQEYFFDIVEKLARSCDAQGFFWDEPHFAMPIYPVGYQSTADWTCRCNVCQKLFEDQYGYPMPRILTNQVRIFRRRQASLVLQRASRIAKSIRKEWSITQCSLPAENNYYLSQERGYDDWEQVAATPEYDIFSTSIVTSYDVPLAVHERLAAKTVELARKYNKVSQRWVMIYLESPADLDMIRQIVRSYAVAGVESIFSWTYRAGQGTVLSAPNPKKVWDLLGEAYGEVLEH
jgi:hypothetical protein